MSVELTSAALDRLNGDGGRRCPAALDLAHRREWSRSAPPPKQPALVRLEATIRGVVAGLRQCCSPSLIGESGLRADSD